VKHGKNVSHKCSRTGSNFTGYQLNDVGRKILITVLRRGFQKIGCSSHDVKSH
jgi:hypothetical protein